MKKKSITYFLFFLLLSCQSEKIERSLIDDFSLDIPLVNDIEDLLGVSEREIPLDTITEALVGYVKKIIKHDNIFYILSSAGEISGKKQILHFDKDGKFISSLDKMGGGPGEYIRIEDFDLFNNNNGKTELWICDHKKIRKYVQSGKSWDFIGAIDFDFVIHKFKIISDDQILFITGQNKESLMLSDINGKPLRTFLKTEIPFLIFGAVHFIEYDSYIVFQLGFANEGVAYSKKDCSFTHVSIVNNKKFLTSKELLNLFYRFGQDYLGELPKTNNISGFRKTKGYTWLRYKYNENRFIAVKKDGVWKKMIVDVKNNYKTATFGASESNDSFILHAYPEDDKLNLIVYEYMLQ